MGWSKSSSKREVYSDTGLLEETRKTSNKQPNLTSKGIRERRTKSKVSRKKEIIKIREEINRDQKNNGKKFMKLTAVCFLKR